MTAQDRVEAALAAIDAHNPATNAFIHVDADGARRQARAVDAERAKGVDRGPLHGAIVSIKDLIDIGGQATTAGSQVLADHVAPTDAPVISRLREAGAILIGKTNLHEFALGTTCEDSGFGPVRHPADPARSPGGSSGGSAVSIVTGMSDLSVGSDTGGSIRIPSAICGLVGLKPSVHDVPKAGVVPLSVTFDHVGPLARSVAEAAALWRVLAGRPNAVTGGRRVKGLRIAVLGGYFQAPLDADVRTAFDSAVRRLRRHGVVTGEATLEHSGAILDAYVKVVLAEAASWHAPYLDTRTDRYRPNVHARLLAGRDVRAVDYLAARDACAAYRRAVDALFDEGYDALVLPTLPITAPVLGVPDVEIDGASVPVRTAMLRNTQLFNMTGHPAITLPLPMPAGAFPAGLQLVGRLGTTADLLAIAVACEKIVH